MRCNRLWAAVAALGSIVPASIAATAHPTDQNDPANPFAQVPSAHYHSIISHYRSSAIMTKPANWRELNDRAEQINGPRGQLRDVTEPIRKRKKK